MFIIAASAFCAGIAGGFLLAAWLSHTWVRREARTRSHQRLLADTCDWYESADCIYLGK